MLVPAAATAAPTKADRVRERELYRYFQPRQSPIAVDRVRDTDWHGNSKENTLSVTAATSPDTTLTALAQLCAIRLQASRAMISVIDREKQYFIAESTKTLDIADTTKCENVGDELWAGCSTVDKAGRLCEKTIELPAVLGKAPCFTVTDLSVDENFKDLPFVIGPPHFKFYAGTPLTTKKGINIGSIFVMDDKVRPHLTADQEALLVTMAQIVMKHMEITSDAEERKKVMRQATGLNSFVEGKSQFDLHAAWSQGAPDLTAKRWTNVDTAKARSNSTKSPKSSIMEATKSSLHQSLRRSSSPGRLPLDSHVVVSTDSQRHRGRNSDAEPSIDSDGSHEDSDTGPNLHSVDSGHRATCIRAANLLVAALDLNGPPRRGGVVFLDATSLIHKQAHQRAGSITQTSSGSPSIANSSIAKPAEVISQSADEGSFTPLDEDLLFNFLRRYPRGKLWSFDVDGTLSSSEEDVLSPSEQRRSVKNEESRAKRRQIEADILQTHFPGSRQLLFNGLWDAATSRWFLGGFAWTTSSQQIFSVDTELNFFRAFGNSVMAEVSRLASIAADRQKSDFIGSISHEFRSPLHGILASAEFLSETDADAFQSSLVDTISSCGRTLLDTINHILDYSKINSFERTWKNVRKPGGRRGPAVHHHLATKQEQAPPMLNIWASTNVASITEEVVEGVYAGQIYQDISSTEVTDFSTGAKEEAQTRGIRFSKIGVVKPVDVILDIESEDYTFITQPGALKRVVMNVFGNALKYTQKGTIMVKVSLLDTDVAIDDGEGPLKDRILQIKVSDTGKGISKQYLRTSLYNAFCQEDVLASGTGLGLSIVKSITTMLNGTIGIESEVGVGTQVTIDLPMSRIPGTDTPVSTPSSTLTDQSQDDSMACLGKDYPSAVVALHGFESDLNTAGHVVKGYIERWYMLDTRPYSDDPGSEAVDLVLMDEKMLPTYLKQRKADIPTVVLCSTGMRPQSVSRFNTPTIVEYVSKPFGPYKLAKGIRVCLDKERAYKREVLPTLSFPTESTDSADSDAGTHVPSLDHLTLETNDPLVPIEAKTNGIVVCGDSENAQKALDDSQSSSNPTSGDETVTEGQDFPFPNQDEEADRPGLKVAEGQYTDSRGAERPDLARRATSPLVKTLPTVPNAATSRSEVAASAGYPLPDDLHSAKDMLLSDGISSNLPESNRALHNGEPAPVPSPSPEPLLGNKRPPRLLLVDDNKINLRLLETFMKKRKYSFVDSAENGQLAVQAAASQEHGYDIIFMDISMPVMNGFEATRAIRDVEEEARTRNPEAEATSPALIIALTGLASSRDQAEAFTSGVDLFMTKPVSFKEVGKLLDNWEAHGGIKGGEKRASKSE